MKSIGRNRNKMKFMVIGCGSIGYRHALNARQVGTESSCYADVRVGQIITA
jgi:ketol-acid reductoisomerase